MIHIVIALDWVSTQTCYVRRYTDEVRAEAINVGGLVFAIFGMGTQLRMESRMEHLPEKTGIIDSEEMTLVYASQDPILMVSVIPRKDNKEIARKKMRTLVQKFNDYASDRLPEWRSSAMGPQIFADFHETLDAALNDGHITEPKIPVLTGKLKHITVDLGILTEQEFLVAKSCDGHQTIYDIAHTHDLSSEETKDILDSLETKKIIQYL